MRQQLWFLVFVLIAASFFGSLATHRSTKAKAKGAPTYRINGVPLGATFDEFADICNLPEPLRRQPREEVFRLSYGPFRSLTMHRDPEEDEWRVSFIETTAKDGKLSLAEELLAVGDPVGRVRERLGNPYKLTSPASVYDKIDNTWWYRMPLTRPFRMGSASVEEGMLGIAIYKSRVVGLQARPLGLREP